MNDDQLNNFRTTLTEKVFDKRGVPDLLIVGNGFDCSLKLNTKYEDFIKSNHFRSQLPKAIPGPGKTTIAQKTPSTDNLFHHINKTQQQKNWCDIESEFVKFAQKTDLERKHFVQQHKDMRDALKNYLTGVENNATLDHTKEAGQVLLNTINAAENLLIVSFNYTNTVRMLLRFLMKKALVTPVPSTKRDRKIEIVHVHGSIKSEIVFGVEDKPKDGLDSKFAFLKKSHGTKKLFSWDSCNRPVSDLMNACSKTVIFGHSLGKSDHSQFQGFFTNPKKKIRIYAYDAPAIQEQIDTMTGGNMTGFIKQCDYGLLDTSQTDPWA